MIVGFLKQASPWGPLLFGVGFVAPLVAQSLDAAALTAPAGLSSLSAGLLVGISWGLVAKLRGRWI